MYGFYGGIGRSTSYKGYITPTFEGYFLTRIMEDVCAGGSISFQRYSFLNDFNPDESTLKYGDLMSIRHRSSYVFFRPKIDAGIGYRQYVHINFSLGPGFLVGGSQYRNQFEPFWTTSSGPYGRDTASVNVTYNIPSIVFRYTLGISERIPTRGYWNIMLSQEFSYVPTSFGKTGPALNSGYISFTVGIMHKYPQVFVEY